jgi:hypothetical protein
MVRYHQCCLAEFWCVMAGSSAAARPFSGNDRVETFGNCRKRGSEAVQCLGSDLDCSKKSCTGTVLPEGPVATSAGASSHKLKKGSAKAGIDLPAGVVDIFPINGDQSRCCCPMQPQRTTLGSCDAAHVFMAQYGAKNLAYLKEREGQEYSSKFLTRDRPFKSLSVSPTLLPFAQVFTQDESDINPIGYSSPIPGGVSCAKLLLPSGGVPNAKFLEKRRECLPNQPWVTTRMRAIAVSWLVEVTVVLNISDEAFHVAICILDKVFRCGLTREQEQVNPQYDWEAEFFCVRICEVQALAWYVFVVEGTGECCWQDLIFRSIFCGFQYMCMDGEQAGRQVQSIARSYLINK